MGTKPMWEVFDYRDGKPVKRFRYRWQARIYTKIVRDATFWDFAREGDGW